MGNRVTTAEKATSRQLAFAKLVVEGKRQVDAYLAIYGTCNPKTAREKACRLAKNPKVVAEMNRLRDRSEVKTLLTLNDRLGILARDAQLPGRTPAMVNARARVIATYSKIAGDEAPQRIELTGKDGAPVPVAAHVLVGRMPIRARIEALKAARAAQNQPQTEDQK